MNTEILYNVKTAVHQRERRLIFCVSYYFCRSAVKYFAKIVKCYRADRFVMLKAVYQTATDVKIFYQLICCYTFSFHCFIKRLVCYHFITELIIFYALAIDNYL